MKSQVVKFESAINSIFCLECSEQVFKGEHTLQFYSYTQI